MGEAHEVPNHFDEQCPYWRSRRGYEIVGFVWMPSEQDRYNAAQASRYEKNLVCVWSRENARITKDLIRDTQLAADGEFVK